MNEDNVNRRVERLKAEVDERSAIFPRLFSHEQLIEAAREEMLALQILIDHLEAEVEEEPGLVVPAMGYDPFAELIVNAVGETGDEGMTPRDLRKLMKRRAPELTGPQTERWLRGMTNMGILEMRIGTKAPGQSGRPTLRFHALMTP